MANLSNINNKFLVTTGGRVGINITAPTTKLHVVGVIKAENTATNAELLQLKYGSSGDAIFINKLSSGNGIVFDGFNGTSWTEDILSIEDTGNVGINTNSPGQKLDVRGGNIMVGGFGGGTDYGLILTPDDGSGYWNIANVTGGALTFNNSNTIGSSEAMRITGGKVGIGTDAPDVKLHVYNGNSGATTVGGASDELILENDTDCGLTIRSGTSSDGVISFADSDDHNIGQVYYSHGSNSMTFRTNDSIAMTINSSGNVGINETSPSNKLQISDSTVGTDSTADDSNFIKLTNKDIGTANEVWGLGFSSKSGATDYLGAFVQALGNFTSNFNTSLIFGTRGTSGNATERMRINSSGNVGIGQTNPQNLLSLSQAGGANIRFDNPTTGYYFIIGEGVGSPNKFSFRGISYRSTDTMTIDFANDRVGIRTHSPSSALNIAGLNSSHFVDLTSSGPGGSRAIRFIDGGTPTKYNWLIGAQHNVNNAFEITASTAVGGTTFNSPLFIVNQSGSVGIGTTSPNQKLVVQADWNGSLSNNQQLQIQGNADTTLQLRLGYDTTNDYAEIAAIKSGTGYKNLILNRGGANVGIGTASPGYRLSVANASTRIVSINYQDSINTIMSHAGSPNYGLEALTIRGDYIAFYTDYDVSHYQGVERMRITSAGQVNIHPINDTSETLRVFRGTGAFASQSISIDAKSGDANIRLLATDTARSTVFYRSSDGGSNFTESMRIGSNGNIAQANTSPIADPFVNGAEQWMTYQIGKAGVLGAYKNNNESMFGFNTYFSAPSGVNKAIVSGLDGTATRYYADRITFNTLTSSGTTQTQTERMRITSGGNINIGSGGLTQTAYQLRVDSDFDNGIYLSAASGNDSALYIDNGAGTAELFIVRGDGNIKIPGIGVTTGATAVGVDSSGFIRKLSSSKRYKKDIESIDIGLDFINSLSPVKFKMKEDDVESVGLIAEDMIDNRFVTYSQIDMKDESKGLQVEGVNYQALIAPLIKSIQELKAEIELLKSK